MKYHQSWTLEAIYYVQMCVATISKLCRLHVDGSASGIVTKVKRWEILASLELSLARDCTGNLLQLLTVLSSSLICGGHVVTYSVRYEPEESIAYQGCDLCYILHLTRGGRSGRSVA